MLDQTNAGGPPDGSEPRIGTALREALRRARLEAAEQTDVLIDLREAEMTRLEILRDELEPIFAQVPQEVDLFDVGLVPGGRPRLFIDMVSFVEMGRDRRVYRFMRDGRHGRSCAAESESTEPIVEAVTEYVARRLIERERLLADDDRLASTENAAGRPLQAAAKAAGLTERTASPIRARPSASVAEPASPPASAVRSSAPAATVARPKRRGLLRVLTILLAFALGGALGAAAVAGVILAVAKGLLPV